MFHRPEPKAGAEDGIAVNHTRRSFAQHVNDEARLPKRLLVVGAMDQKAAHAHLAQLGEGDFLRAVGRA